MSRVNRTNDIVDGRKTLAALVNEQGYAPRDAIEIRAFGLFLSDTHAVVDDTVSEYTAWAHGQISSRELLARLIPDELAKIDALPAREGNAA